MKIISFNISRFSQEKLDHILSNKADIYILPELASPQMVSLPEGYKMEWMGDFLDYAFTNIPIKDFQLFEWDREISDHVGQLIEI